ncbi:MAG: GNVR domain-containing protein [bacterium]
MDKHDVFPIDNYIDIAFRRKWHIIIPFIVSIIITGCVYKMLPKIYRSDTLILVLPQKVPEDYVQSTITSTVEARLSTITEEVLSRTRLQTIINEFNLYPKARDTLTMDQIIAKARKDIEIEIKQNRRRSNDDSCSFTIYYQGEDPETVRKVTNKLASLFIEENLKTREQQASVTTTFLSRELESAKKKLEELERSATEFKFQNIGNLPEQNDSNLERLKQLDEQRQMISDYLAKAVDKELLLRQQLSEAYKFMEDENSNSLQAQLDFAKNQLSAAKASYTDNHIDVRKLREQIKQLEYQLLSKKKEEQSKTDEKPQTIMPVAQDLKNQIDLINKEIIRLKKEDERIKKKIATYEERIEEAPRVALQLAALTRDYENTKFFYEEVLRKKLSAEQAENLEKRQQGEQFRILDPASLPKIPYKPNPQKTLALGLLLGLGAGLGLTYFAEMANKSFRNEKEAEEYLNVPVLAAIPRLKKEDITQLMIHRL